MFSWGNNLKFQISCIPGVIQLLFHSAIISQMKILCCHLWLTCNSSDLSSVACWNVERYVETLYIDMNNFYLESDNVHTAGRSGQWWHSTPGIGYIYIVVLLICDFLDLCLSQSSSLQRTEFLVFKALWKLSDCWYAWASGLMELPNLAHCDDPAVLDVIRSIFLPLLSKPATLCGLTARSCSGQNWGSTQGLIVLTIFP